MKIKTLANHCIDAIKKGGKILIAGNGGSAAQAQHFSAELLGKYKHKRRALPAIALTTDTSALTAIANDYDFNQVFQRQLEALGKKGDVFIGLSTSGKSENVNRALLWAKENGLKAVDFERIGDSTSETQEHQLVALHELAELIEEAFV